MGEFLRFLMNKARQKHKDIGQQAEKSRAKPNIRLEESATFFYDIHFENNLRQLNTILEE
jgi:hypothetical protein